MCLTPLLCGPRGDTEPATSTSLLCWAAYGFPAGILTRQITVLANGVTAFDVETLQPIRNRWGLPFGVSSA